MTKNFAFFALLLVLPVSQAPGDDEIPIAEIKRNNMVDFDKEILPIIRQNCLACHSSTDAEGDIILENVSNMIQTKAVIPGKPSESSILVVASHQDDPVMPPEDNEVKANNLTPQQLGLLKLWIEQGAKASATTTVNKVEFAKLPKGVNPVYAMAMSHDGQYLAAGRANQVFVYQVPSKTLVTRVTDPALTQSKLYQQAGIAHLDIVQSLAFAPNNRMFVSGGFRNVKIWEKGNYQASTMPTEFTETASSLGFSNSRAIVALGSSTGSVFVFSLQAGKKTDAYKTGDKPVELIAIQNDGLKSAIVSEKRKLRLFDGKTKKQVGREITLDNDAVSIAFASGNQKILAGLADNTIDVYSIEAFAKDPSEKLAPDQKMSGHSKPPVLLRPHGENESSLLTAADDGTAKMWDLATGKNTRSFSFSGQVCGLEISSDGSRVATCSTNGSVKIFNAQDSKLVKEIKGDLKVEFQIANNDRMVRLKQQLVDATKKDLDAGTKEKTAEEANVKKTEETLKKADEDLKNKLAAKTKSEKDFDTANKALETRKTEIAGQEKQKTELEGKLKPEMEKLAKLDNKIKTDEAQLKKLTDAKTAADKGLKTTQAEFAKDKTNEAAKKAVETATQAQAKAVAALKTAQETKTKNAADKTAIANAIKAFNAQKVELDKKLVTGKADLKKQEANVKKMTEAKKKGTDDHSAAQRAQTLATNGVTRAKERAKKVSEKIPVLDGDHKKAIAAKAEQEKTSKTFKAGNEKKLVALSGITRLDDGSLAYWDTTGQYGRCDFNSGEKTDSFAFPQSAKARTVLAIGKTLFAFSQDVKTVSKLSIDDNWRLARTIGNIDDPKTFVDRVTAVDISPDGTHLATGTGEPSRSGEIKIWKVADGSLVKEIKDAHSDTILDLKFSPDGNQIASGSSDRFMKTFDLSSGKLIRIFEGHTHHVMSVDWNSIGRELSSAGADKVVKIWDAQTGTQKRTIAGYGKEVTALCFVELSNQIITASGDKTVRLKRTDNGGEVRQFAGNGDFVYTVATSADGKKFAAGGEDSVVRVWNDNGQVFVQFPPPKE